MLFQEIHQALTTLIEETRIITNCEVMDHRVGCKTRFFEVYACHELPPTN